ncbi:MAG: hypothetical protein QG577_683 [Thermodesulfobacteriota bacterium]|nr:hypothetical protein [Thermodesulfobacteriota bacterium]
MTIKSIQNWRASAWQDFFFAQVGGLWARNLVSVRKLGPIASVGTGPVSVALAGKVCFETYVGGPVHGDFKREVAHSVVLQTTTRNVASCPDLIGLVGGDEREAYQ